MKTVRNLLAFALFSAGAAYGQGYDCRILFSVNTVASTSTAAFDNRSTGCNFWTLDYQATNFATITLTFQSATGAVTPGAFGAFSGTTVTGINPNTSIVGAQSTFSGFASWLRVTVSGTLGAGSPLVNGVLYGYHSGYGATVTSGCPGTAVTPCVVDGPTAAGAAPTTPPVLIAGQDGAPGVIRTIKTDATGQLIPANASSAAADGIANTEATATGAAGGILYPRVFDMVFNGTTWDRLAGNTSGVAPTNASSATADALSATQLSPTAVGGGVLYPRVFEHAFNGTTLDRVRTASLANLTPATTLTARNSIGAPLGGERGSRFTVVSTPAAGTVGSASIASEASVRHVADHVCFSATATGAVAATSVTVALRDGATGAGTIIWQAAVAIPVAAGTGQQEVLPFCTPALDLVGTTATAMTAEFSTGATNLVESITLTGYNVN